MNYVFCSNGHRIGTGAFPNENVFVLMSEQSYDDVEDPVSRADLEKLYLTSPKCYRCGECDEIVVCWNQGSETVHYKRIDIEGSGVNQ